MSLLQDIFKNKQLNAYLTALNSSFPLNLEEFSTEDSFISSSLLIGALEQFFSKAKLSLPNKLKALDIGAGPWHYAPALHSFLSNFQRHHDAELHGIDIQGKHWQDDIKKRITNPHIHYHAKDIFYLKENNAYDVAFLIHMFPPYRFKQHGIPFKPYNELFKKIFELIKKDGLLVAIAYGAPEEEYSFFDDIPKENVLKKGRYTSSEATQIDFILGKDTFHNNVVMIAKK